MAAVPEGANVTEPVSGRSRPVRRAGTRYTEVAASPVVWEPHTRTLHELSPGAAALWASLDGGPLGEIITSALPVDDEDGLGSTLVEAVRRLRALGLVEDARDGAAGPPLAEPCGGPPLVTLRGRLVAVEGGVLLVLPARLDPATTATATDPIRIDAHARAIVDSGARVLALIVVDDGTEAPGPQSPIRLLDALAAAAGDDLDLDALALLAETTPGFAVPLMTTTDVDTLSRLVAAPADDAGRVSGTDA